jgi:hypothetical protein
MENVIVGATGCSNNHAPILHVGTYRRNILAVVIGCDLFTAEEQLRCNHHVAECEDAQRLARWVRNVRLEAQRREQAAELSEAAHVQPVTYATAAQTSEVHQLTLHRFITTGERTKAMLALPTLTALQATLLIGELWAKVLHRTELEAIHTDPVLPRYSREAWRNRQQVYLLELRATLPQAIAAHDQAVASRATLAQGAPNYYLEHVAEGWALDEQGSRLHTAALLLGFADLAEARQQLPFAEATLPALSTPAELSHYQAC